MLGRRTPASAPWFVLALAAVLAFAWPVPARIATHLPGASGDNWIFCWNIWWFREALWKRFDWPFATDLLFHPHGARLAYHTTTLLGTLPGSLLATVLPLPVAFNVVFLGCFLFAALATYGLALHVLGRAGVLPGRRRLLAAFAGFAYAFAPFHVAHVGHLNILNVGAVPLAVWMALRLFERPSARRALVLGAALGACTLADGYHLLAAGLALPFVFFVMGGRAARPQASWLRWGALAVAAFTLVSLPVLLPMWMYGSRGLEDVRAGGANDYVADLLSWIVPSPFHPLWGRAFGGVYDRLSGNRAENVVFPTYTVIALAWLAWRGGQREARAWIGLASAFAVLSLGPFLHVAGRDGIAVGDGFWRLPLPKVVLDALPLVSGARAAGRFASVAQLGLALAAMLGLVRWRRWQGSGEPRALGPALGACAALALECCAWPLPTVRAEVPPAYAVLAAEVASGRPPGAVLEIPPVHAGDKIYQYWQTVHGLPLLGGRLARTPRHAYDALHRDPFLDRVLSNEPWRPSDGMLSLAGLDSLGVRYVVLHSREPQAVAIRRVLEARFEPVAAPGEAILLRRRASPRE